MQAAAGGRQVNALACGVVGAQVACTRQGSHGIPAQLQAGIVTGELPDRCAAEALAVLAGCRRICEGSCKALHTVSAITFLSPRQYDVLAAWGHHIVINSLRWAAWWDGRAAGRHRR